MSFNREVAELTPLSLATVIAFTIGTNAITNSGPEVDLTQPATVIEHHAETDRHMYIDTDGKSGLKRQPLPPAYMLTVEQCLPDDSTTDEPCATAKLVVQANFYKETQRGSEVIIKPVPQVIRP